MENRAIDVGAQRIALLDGYDYYLVLGIREFQTEAYQNLDKVFRDACNLYTVVSLYL
jgi:hypothetical protein